MTKYNLIKKIMDSIKINEDEKLWYIEMVIKGWLEENEINWILNN